MKGNNQKAILPAALGLVAVGSLLAAAYFGFQNMASQRTIAQLRAQLEEQTSQKIERAVVERSTVQFSRKPKSTDYKVTCAFCDGETRLILQVSRGKQETYPCPVCKAQGSQKIRVLAEGTLCKPCRGMGKLPTPSKYDPKVTHRAKICVKCQGRGWHKVR